jgi:hypothetical protein
MATNDADYNCNSNHTAHCLTSEIINYLINKTIKHSGKVQLTKAHKKHTKFVWKFKTSYKPSKVNLTTGFFKHMWQTYGLWGGENSTIDKLYLFPKIWIYVK